jgi:hypothetical protein
MSFWTKLFGREKRDVASEQRGRPPAELDVAPRLGSVAYNPDTSVLMACHQCASQVVVDKRKRVAVVHCMECAMDIVKRNNLKAELRVPFD